MLNFIRQGQRWIVTTLVALVGAVFILFFGPWDFSQTGGNASVPVEVDGIQYTIADVQRVRDGLERQYRDALGDRFDELSPQLQLQDRAVRQLVDRAILAAEAKRLGLAASSSEVERLIRGAFSDFRDEQGRIDEERARNYVVYEWGSVRRFKEEVASDVILRKMGRLLLGSAGASRAEARDALAYREEQVRIAFVSLDPSSPPDDLEVVPGDVEEFLRNEAQRVSDAYQADLERYQLPERMRLRHILIRTDDSDEETARAAAEAARARIEAGEDMASVAQELSDDEGSKELGGDLGLLPVSQVASALREAVADLEPGGLAPVTRGEQGFHVVRLEERRSAETRTLEEVGLEIADALYREEQGERWVKAKTEELAAEIAGGRSLEEAARTLGLNIERTSLFSRRPDGFIQDLGESVEAQTAAFSLTTDAPTWPEPIEVGPRTVFVQLLERRDPDPTGFEARVEQERERLEEAAQQRSEQAWLAARRTELQA
ncbi:MAG: hypothetical protein HKP30_07535, partial [Myxococcales bacterium]|nr:hypothetical protein [Myxococcales bacterium]